MEHKSKTPGRWANLSEALRHAILILDRDYNHLVRLYSCAILAGRFAVIFLPKEISLRKYNSSLPSHSCRRSAFASYKHRSPLWEILRAHYTSKMQSKLFLTALLFSAASSVSEARDSEDASTTAPPRFRKHQVCPSPPKSSFDDYESWTDR